MSLIGAVENQYVARFLRVVMPRTSSFSMIEGMMPAWPAIPVMGWLIVLISLLIAAFTLAPAQATFYSEAKAVRGGAQVGSALIDTPCGPVACR